MYTIKIQAALYIVRSIHFHLSTKANGLLGLTLQDTHIHVDLTGLHAQLLYKILYDYWLLIIAHHVS